MTMLRRGIKRILSLLLLAALLVQVTALSFAVGETNHVADGTSVPSATFNASSNYISEIKFSQNNSDLKEKELGADIRWDNENNRYCAALPETRSMSCYFSACAKEDVDTSIQYAVINPTTKKKLATQMPLALNKFVNIATNTKPSAIPVGGAADFVIEVGTGSWNTSSGTFDSELEAIPLHVYSKVVLSNLEVSAAEGTALELSEKFNSITYSYGVDVTDDQTEITLTPTPNTALATDEESGTVLTYTDADGSPITPVSDKENTFAIQSLPKNENGVSYICVTVSYSGAAEDVGSTTYTVKLTKPTPAEVKALGETTLDVETGSDTKLEVKVTNDNAEENAEYTYQWYCNLPDRAENYKGNPISGATNASYQVDTTHAESELGYWCDVTKTIKGVPLTTHSPIFYVTVVASSASFPIITQQPEDVTVQENSYATFEISAMSMDAYATLSVQLYFVTSDGETTLKGEYSTPNRIITSLRFRLDTNKRGDYQYYCVVTNTVNGYQATTRSETITLTVEGIAGDDQLKGTGTESDPYQIASLEDLKTLKSIVENGYSLSGKYIKLMNDLTLPIDWDPIGNLKEGHPEITDLDPGTGKGKFVNPFSGNFDGGGNKITIANGGQALFRYVRQATIHDLRIYGENINGSALINGVFIDYGPTGVYNQDTNNSMWTAKIDNVTLLSGSHTTSAGFLSATGSGMNTVTITNSTVEKGVVIGSEGAPGGGSFVSGLNGSLTNCVSYATVYGGGGLVGHKSQTMGACSIENSAFLGELISDSYAGGIIGSGYDFEAYFRGTTSAPNTPLVRINNCYVNADITGQYIVGGIFGGEPCVREAWGNGIGAITNNVFVGTLHDLSGTSDVGGIVGYLNSFDKFQGMSHNYYNEDCGTTKGIGRVKNVVYAKDNPTYGVEQEPDWSTMTYAENKRLTDGSLVDILNKAPRSYGNWIQGKVSPVHSDSSVANELEISGEYRTEYTIGDELDLSGAVFTAKYTDGSSKEVSIDEIKVDGYDPNTHGVQTVTFSFGAAQCTIKVTVYRPEGTITIKFALMGDDIHTVSSSNTHTLAGGGLQRWIPSSGEDKFVTYTVDNNATVKDIVEMAVGKENISNPSGNYIESITWNDITLAEFSNGANSGWMYTINGVHSNLGVSEQFLNDGDEIVFHYTDDHNKESAIGGPTTPSRDGLLELIKQAEALKEADYTPESWANLQYALAAARETAKNEGALAAEIEHAQNALTQAIEELQRVKVPDFRQALNDTLYYIAQTVPAPSFGTTSGEWSVLALARGGYDPGAGYFDEYYDRIVEKVKSISTAPKLHPQKSTDNSRLILALSAIGRDPQNVGGVNLLTPLADMDWVEYQGVNGPIFALLALDANNYPNPGENTRQKLIDRIISNQLGNGGFPITPGGDVDLDMTAMALQALAPHKDQDNVGKAIDRALAYLASVQNSNGGFGNNSEVNVQVIVALSALGIDAKGDPRFVKSGGDPVTALLNYSVGNGGFKHLMTQTGSNAMATDQAGYALVAYTRFLDHKNSLYNMTDVELVAAGTVEVPVNPEVNGTTATAKPGKDLDAALETAKIENKGIISVTVAEKKADKVAVILNSITANAIAEANKTLNVTTENGGLSIAHQTLKSIAEQAAQIASVDEIVLNVERKKNEDEAVNAMVTSALQTIADSLGSVSGTAKQASIVEVTITVNNTPITQFGGNTLSIDLPVSRDLYTAGQLYKTLVISDGRTEEISGRCRDLNGKRVVTVRTTHLSTFVVIPVLAATKPVEPEKPERPGGNGEIEVRITILGDSVHGETSTPHTLAGKNLDTWVSQTEYTLKEGSTVWDLLKKVFADNGMTCSNPSGNYVESITWKGKTLGEFTNGKNSGWMYTLNGTHPSLGVSEQELHDGDRVVWHYTDDYTKEEGSEKWSGTGAKPELETGILQPLVTADKNGVALAELAYYEVENMIAAAKEYNWKELIIQPKVEGTASKIGIVLSKEITSMITDKSDLSLSLRTKYGDAALTNAGLTELSKTMKESLTMSVEKTETGTVKVDVLVDGKRVNTVKDGLRVSIPVEENGNVIAVIENGTEKIIRKSIVDGKRLLAVMDGSCELRVLDNSKRFGDIEGHWGKTAIGFASSHELFNGTGPERFEPDTAMSRAMLATVLYRLEDAVADGSNPFADVASGTWYTDAVIWASGSGIVNGTGSGFAPDRDVTRQELVAMLYRYSNSIGMDTGNTGSLDKFTDRNSVAEWAKDAMSWAVANGLVNGRTATTLAPEGTATRAEVAAILQRLVTKIVNA